MAAALDTVLYPPLLPYREEWVKVSDLHTVHYEECGTQKGKPVLFVHGGPGGGIRPDHRRYFNPQKYRIILVDQRGCGKSTPHAELRENTTQHLIQDFETIRTLLGIDQWMILGGSWGTTLGLAYAEAHPERVTEIILRGIFLGHSEELKWMYQWGAHEIFPDYWENYIAEIPEDERHDMMLAYHKRLTSDDLKTRQKAARAWSIWEACISKLYPDTAMMDSFGEDEFSIAFARIESHYFQNHLFLKPTQLLDDAHKLRGIPGVIIHGRYDICCPVRNAWLLHRAWPEAELNIIPDAGHSMSEPGIAKTLIATTDRFS